MEGTVLSSSLELLSENRRHPEVISLDDSDDSPAASPMSRAVAHSPEDGQAKIKGEPSAESSPTSQEVTSLGAPEPSTAPDESALVTSPVPQLVTSLGATKPSTTQGESFTELPGRMADDFFQRHEDEFRRELVLSVPVRRSVEALARRSAQRPSPAPGFESRFDRRSEGQQLCRELRGALGLHLAAVRREQQGLLPDPPLPPRLQGRRLQARRRGQP